MTVRRISQQRYSQLYSLQLAMDTDGNFAKLPENVADVYQQRSVLEHRSSRTYQTVPTAP